MKPRIKIFFLCLFFVCFFIFIFQAIIFPLFFEFRENLKRLIQNEKKLLAMENQTKIIKEFLGEKRNGRLSELDKIFFDPKFPLPLIEFLKEKSKLSGVIVENISFQSPSGKEKKAPTISLLVRGEAENLFKFFLLIENSFFISQSQDFHLFKKDEKDYFLQVTFSLVTI